MLRWPERRLAVLLRRGVVDLERHELGATQRTEKAEEQQCAATMGPAAIAKHLGIARSTVYRLLDQTATATGGSNHTLLDEKEALGRGDARPPSIAE